jgi:hypothetical protein
MLLYVETWLLLLIIALTAGENSIVVYAINQSNG